MPGAYGSYVDHFSPQQLGVAQADAPEDGQTYGRQNGTWVPISTGPSGDFLPLTGGTMTGPLDVKSPSNAPGVTVDDPWGDNVVVGPYSININNVSNYPASLVVNDHSGVVVTLNANGLVVKGDKFCGDTAAIINQPVPALMIENAAATEQFGLAIGQYGDCLTVVKANGTPAPLRLGSFIGLPYPNGVLTIGTPANGFDFNDASGFHVTLAPVSSGDLSVTTTNPSSGFLINSGPSNAIVSRLYFDNTTGDLMVAQTTGPNAGKSVNLTATHWA